MALPIAVAASLMISACSSNGASSAAGSKSAGSGGTGATTTLTLWENFGGAYNGTATQKLADAFEAENPGIKINVVSQPADNYFSLLQAAAISKTNGPDLVVMWGGLYALQHTDYLQNLKDLVPQSATSKMIGMKWVSQGFDVDKGAYMIPLENQFYAAFYNKKLFDQAGITKEPQTWDELYAACQKLKDINVTCMEYASGSTNQAASGEFYPWYDMSYLVIGATPLADLEGLYNGKIAWTSPKIVSQLQHWSDLYAKGYTNKDVLSAHKVMDDFEGGKAAIIVKGNWVVPSLTKSLGDNLGVMLPPFSDTPIDGVTEFPGDGYSMTSYSQHKQEAAKFLTFLTTDAAAKIVDDNNLIPAVEGASTSNSTNQALLDFAAKDHKDQYPLIDNVLQAGVVDAGTRVLPQLLAGQVTPEAAASQLAQAWKALPESQRGASWSTYSVQ